MASSHFSAPTILVFTGENYALWNIKMKAYLQAFDLWEVVERDKDSSSLRANPTVAQMKQHMNKNYMLSSGHFNSGNIICKMTHSLYIVITKPFNF